MTTSVAGAYDDNAELYASLFLHDLDRQTVRDLATFAEWVSGAGGEVVDVGCGPGGTVAHLAELGLSVRGIDISPGQIAQARAAFAGLTFDVGDLTALEVDDDCLGGIVSKYSIIHLPPAQLGGVFEEWHRALRPGAPVFVSFFGSRSAAAHGTAFDHKVVTAHELWPATVASALEAAGFVEVQVTATPIPEGGRPFDHTTVLARASQS